MAKFIQNLIDEIIDQYVYADETNRPWIIGFSQIQKWPKSLQSQRT